MGNTNKSELDHDWRHNGDGDAESCAVRVLLRHLEPFQTECSARHFGIGALSKVRQQQLRWHIAFAPHNSKLTWKFATHLGRSFFKGLLPAKGFSFDRSENKNTRKSSLSNPLHAVVSSRTCCFPHRLVLAEVDERSSRPLLFRSVSHLANSSLCCLIGLNRELESQCAACSVFGF